MERIRFSVENWPSVLSARWCSPPKRVVMLLVAFCALGVEFAKRI